MTQEKKIVRSIQARWYIYQMRKINVRLKEKKWYKHVLTRQDCNLNYLPRATSLEKP
jgi:hypothetical protein